MNLSAEFWLDLHRVEAHLQGGDPERIEALAVALQSVPPATRDVFLGRLEEVLHSLTELNARCERWRASATHSV